MKPEIDLNKITLSIKIACDKTVWSERDPLKECGHLEDIHCIVWSVI